MNKILISGYLGFENFGDEALLYVLVKNLLELGIQRNNITVISNNPNITANTYNVYAINRWNFFEMDQFLLQTKLLFFGIILQRKAVRSNKQSF